MQWITKQDQNGFCFVRLKIESTFGGWYTTIR